MAPVPGRTPAAAGAHPKMTSEVAHLPFWCRHQTSARRPSNVPRYPQVATVDTPSPDMLWTWLGSHRFDADLSVTTLGHRHCQSPMAVRGLPGRGGPGMTWGHPGLSEAYAPVEHRRPRDDFGTLSCPRRGGKKLHGPQGDLHVKGCHDGDVTLRSYSHPSRVKGPTGHLSAIRGTTQTR